MSEPSVSTGELTDNDLQPGHRPSWSGVHRHRRVIVSAGVAAALVGAYGLGTIGGGAASATPASPLRTVATTDAEAAGGISVEGTGTASGVPDSLLLALSVSGQAKDAQSALNQVNDAIARVSAALNAKGVAAKDRQTTGLSLQPHWDNKGRTDGFDASESMTAKLAPLNKAGNIISAVVNAGGDNVRIDGVSLNLAADSTLVQQARARAFADAKAKAEQYAELSGRTLGEVTSISESTNTTSPVNARVAMPMSAGAAASDVSVDAGEQSLSVSVDVTWAIH